MLRKAAAFIWACLLTSSAAAQVSDGLTKDLVSTSLCGDAYGLALAQPRLAAMSWQSRGALSQASVSQRALPQAWPSAERLIALRAGSVLFGPGEGFELEPILTAAGIGVIRLDWGETEADILRNAQKLGVDFIPPKIAAPQGPRPSILYLSRSGGSAGAQTFVDTAITLGGGDNIWSKHPQPRKGWFTPDPEELASLAPDLIVTSFFSNGFESAQAKSLTGGVHKSLLSKTPSVEVPGKLWPCAAPQLYDAAAIIRGAVEQWRSTP